MPFQIKEELDGRVLEVTVTEKLTRADYEMFVPQVERLIQRHGKIRVLMTMRDFHGWELSALWEDIKFDVKHFRDIERLAMVGEKKWQEGMSKFCKPFTSADIRYFDLDEMESARRWVMEGLVAHHQV